MLRRTTSQYTRTVATSIPPNFLYASDMAFYYPRFQPRTHVQSMGIPEIQDAVSLLQPPFPAEIREAEALELSERLSRERDSPRMKGINPNSQNKISALNFLTPENMFLSEWTSAYLSPAELHDREKGLMYLERGIDIMEGINAGQYTNTSIMNLLRPLYAARFAILQGVEHLPRPSYAKHVHVQKKVLEESAKLLYYNDTWDKTDVKLIDCACVILCHFIKAFVSLHPRPFHANPPPPPAKKNVAASRVKKSSSSSSSSNNNTNNNNNSTKTPSTLLPRDWSMKVSPSLDPSAVLTMDMVMDRIEELLRLTEEVERRYGNRHPELRWHVPKLLLLKGLWHIPHTGNLLHSLNSVHKAVETVFQHTAHDNIVLQGLEPKNTELEWGLYRLAEVEVESRIFGWDLIEPEYVDGALLASYRSTVQHYAAGFDTAIDADGISDAKYFDSRTTEILAHNCASVSYANFLLNAPRPPGTSTKDSPVFLPKQLYDQNPLLTVNTSSDMIFNTTSEVDSMSINAIRSNSYRALEKALSLNRGILPEHRNNSNAALILQSMASVYADTRDYLHATGLYESSLKALVELYGANSLEVLHLHKLRYEFLSGVGSDQESKTASHEIIHLLKTMDALPY